MRHLVTWIGLLLGGLAGFGLQGQMPEAEALPLDSIKKYGIQQWIQHGYDLTRFVPDEPEKKLTLAKESSSITQVYNRQGMVLKRTEAFKYGSERWVSYEYNVKGQLVRMTEEVQYSSMRDRIPHSTYYVYDPLGRLESEETYFHNNPHKKVAYSYEEGRLSQMVRSNWIMQYIPREREAISWRDSVKVTTLFRRNSQKQSWETDAIHIATFDAQDRMIRKRVTEPGGKLTAEYFFTYNPMGRLIEQRYYDLNFDGWWQDEEGNLLWNYQRYQYDEKGFLVQSEHWVEDELQRREKFQYELQHFR